MFCVAITIIIGNKVGNKYKNVSAIVLSGGKSSRMGTDKCDLNYNGKSLISIAVEKMRALGIEDIIASGYRGKDCDAKVVSDDIMKGPLSGILKGLMAMSNDRAFVISVDVPLVRKESIKRLLDYSLETGLEITILRHKGKIEPLISVFDRSVASKIEDVLKEEKHSVMKLVDRCRSGFCDIDDDDKYYMNINYREDYDALLKM